MKNIMQRKGRLLYSQELKDILVDDPLTLIDVGARGDLDEPWCSMEPSSIRIIGFEPDEKECQTLNEKFCHSNRKYYPFALWSEETEVKIHVARTATCSSIYPPNWNKINVFRRNFCKPRETLNVAVMPAKTLEGVINSSGNHCDFLKIDTQGAEFEILLGAGNELNEKVFAVVAETWTTEVHLGQRLSGEILNLMQSKGFALFDVNTAAAWNRRTSESFDFSGKHQIVGLDFLFFNEKLIEKLAIQEDLPKLAKGQQLLTSTAFPILPLRF